MISEVLKIVEKRIIVIIKIYQNIYFNAENKKTYL